MKGDIWMRTTWIIESDNTWCCTMERVRYWLHVAVSAHNKFSRSHFQFIPSNKVRVAFGRGGVVDSALLCGR